MVLHCFSWAPLVINYGALEEHSDEVFDNWTIDGDYVHANFGDDLSRYFVVEDSDDIALVSFTKARDSAPPIYPFWLFRLPGIGNRLKALNLQRYWNNAATDPLKKKIFSTAVHWHADEPGNRYRAVANRAAGYVAVATAPMTQREEAIADFALSRVRFIIPFAVERFFQRFSDLTEALRRIVRIFVPPRLDPPHRAVGAINDHQKRPGTYATLALSPVLTSGR